MHKSFYLFAIFLMYTCSNNVLAQEARIKLKWDTLPPIPDTIGFAGSFVGVSNGTLLVGGGANFPDGGAPWTGSAKVWYDKIFALENPAGVWKEVGKLPYPLGYGVSISWKNAFILIGGSNEKEHHREVWMLTYKNGKIERTALPDLPKPIANSTGALVGDVIYIAGGTESPEAKTTEKNFWALDLAAAHKSWKKLEAWPGPSRMLAVAGAQEGVFYLFSGAELIAGNRQYLKDAYQYTPHMGWEKIADLPRAVTAAPTPAYAVDQSHLLIFGGDDGELAPQADQLKAHHPGFSKTILSYNASTNAWKTIGEIFTDKKEDAVTHPNASIWAPVTTSLTLWKDHIIIPGGEVRPATRTPNVLAVTCKEN